MKITSLEELKKILKQYSVPIEKWGRDGYKNISDL